MICVYAHESGTWGGQIRELSTVGAGRPDVSPLADKNSFQPLSHLFSLCSVGILFAITVQV